MKTSALAVVVIVFASVATSVAQDMVEYSHAATLPAASLQGLANKVNESLQKAPAKGSSGAQVQTISPAKGGATPEPVAKPTPPALFILADGKQLESSHYFLTAQNLVVEDGPKPQTIPLTALNRDATIAANEKRGINLKFPNSPSQMTISF